MLYGIIGSETSVWLNRYIFDGNTSIKFSHAEEGLKALKSVYNENVNTN